METAALILFAIQSALKLGAQARQAYVESTIGAAVVLPLPDFATNFGPDQARDRILSVVDKSKWPPGAAALIKKFDAGETSDVENQRLVALGLEVRLTDTKELGTIK